VSSANHALQVQLCKSGFAIGTVCATLKNTVPVNQTCTEDCKYTLTNATVVTVPSSCKCGYNPKKESYCDLGSGEQLNVDFVSLRNATLADVKLCHTLERGYGYCLEKRRTDKSASFRRQSQKISNTRILSENSPKLQNADDCVKYVAFNYDSSTIIPDKFKCAKYSCKKDDTTCASSKNPFNDAGDGVEVTLGKKCDKGMDCYLGQTGTEVFYTNATTALTCKNMTVPEIKVRFPGEECEVDSDCFNDVSHPGACYGKKCWGMNETQPCNATESCVVGLYCDLVKGQCTKQRKEGEPCVYGWDCQNHLGCHDGTCKAFGSLKEGINVTSAMSNWDKPEDVFGYGRRMLCEYASMDKNGDVCSQFNYFGATLGKKNADGFVPCDKDDLCSYADLNNNTVSLPCGCGYNDQGQGYCPLPNKVNEKDWKGAVKNLIKRYQNKCHSIQRFNCYISNNDKSLQATQLTDAHKTAEAHLFYKAVPCAYDILSGSIAKVSLLSIAVLLAFIF